ncbi:MAG: hypothetical protein HYX50_04830 [Chloroflexi bacterium]|nr:hypothetical protein [Chloroflexota bacterium]
MTVPAQQSAATNRIVPVCVDLLPEVARKHKIFVKPGTQRTAAAVFPPASPVRDGARSVHPPVPAGPSRTIVSFQSLLECLAGRIERMERERDPRAAYCRAYAAGVLFAEAVAAHSEGDAGRWLERVELESGRAYFAALDGGRGRDRGLLAVPWRAAFEATARGNAGAGLRAQILAHVGYTLPLAVARAGVEPECRRLCGRAFAEVTEMLASNADAVARVAGLPRRWPWQSAGTPVFCDWWTALRRKAWSDGLALVDAIDAEERGEILVRLEGEAVRSISAARLQS